MLGHSQQVSAMIDYQTPRFKTSEAAIAASMSPATLRSYFKRGQFKAITLDRREPDSDGLPSQFSRRDALLLGVAADVIAAGVNPERAFRASAHFSHAGTDERPPSTLFAQGLTLLVYRPKSGLARIINSGPNLDLAEAFAPISSDKRDPLIIVEINSVYDTVMAALNI